MFVLDDSITINFPSGLRRAYHAYCDCCGKSRGYLLKTIKNSRRLCKTCAHHPVVTQELRNKFPNVDFDNYIDKLDGNKSRRLYKCRCPKCDCDRGYARDKRFTNLCRSCVNSGRNHTLENRIKQSCLKRNIDTREFDDFTSSQRKRERLLFDQKQLALKCLNLHNFTCNVCGQRGGVLNAHHLNSWHSHKELRFDIANLVCLCEECHRNFHREFSYKNNTIDQYSAFKAQSNGKCCLDQ